MKELCKAMEDLPLIVKVILAIPALDLVWNVYRLCKAIDHNNVLEIVIAILLFFCCPFLWVVDIISILLTGNVLWFK